MKKFMCIVMLFAMMFTVVGCDDDAPAGTLWFCVLKYKHSDKIVAAWASKKKPFTLKSNEKINHIIGKSNDGSEICEFKDLSLEAELDEKVFSFSTVDIKKVLADYPKYADDWVGVIPSAFEEKKDIPKQVKEKKNEGSHVTVELKFTYKVKRKRKSVAEKHRYHITRSDGEEITSCKTAAEADRLIEYLK